MVIGALTHTGMVRQINEDSYYISKFDGRDDSGFCIIADGMGGHNAGEIASQMAIEEIRAYVEAVYDENMSNEQIIEMLYQCMERANRIIYDKACNDVALEGMGTTAIIGLIHDHNIYLAHVGDSRAYMIRNRNMEQITTDHSMVEELIHSGTITREEALNHPQKNIITRALGGDENTRIDIYVHKCKKDDIILLCTDGLTNMLRDEEILDVIDRYEDLQASVEELIRLANEKGGLDNVTVIMLGL